MQRYHRYKSLAGYTGQDNTQSFLSLKSGIDLTASVPFSVIFLHPSEVTAANQEPGLETIIVTITIKIPADAREPNTIESLVAEIAGTEVLGFKSAKAEFNSFLYDSKEAEGSKGLQMKPGQTYQWDVALSMSNNDTPREFIDDSSTFQYINVKLKWADKSQQRRYRDLEAKQRVYVLCVPNSYNDLAYFRLHQSIVDRLGPIVALLKTPNLTLGGHLHIGLYLASIPSNCSLQAVTINILQRVTLVSRQHGEYREALPWEKIDLLNLRGEEVRKGLGGQVNTFDHITIARVGLSSRLRPSTMAGSNAKIVLHHKVELRIYYTWKENGKMKPLIYTAIWPIMIASCGCRLQNLTLPSYDTTNVVKLHDGSEPPPSTFVAETIKARPKERFHCACDVPLSELLESDVDYNSTKTLSVKELYEREMESQRWSQGHESSTAIRPTEEVSNGTSEDDQRPEDEERKARQMYRPVSTSEH